MIFKKNPNSLTACRHCEKELHPEGRYCRNCGQVVFADEELEAAVREKLKIPEEPLTEEVIVELTSLDIDEIGNGFTRHSSEIKDLRGLEFAVNLTYLELWHFKGSGLGPLATLTNLTDLIVGDSQGIDLGPLATLINLTHLDLSDNQVSDLSPLASLTNLRFLKILFNPLNQQSIDVHVPNIRDRGAETYTFPA